MSLSEMYEFNLDKAKKDDSFLLEGFLTLRFGENNYPFRGFALKDGTFIPEDWENFQEVAFAPPGSQLVFVSKEDNKEHLVLLYAPEGDSTWFTINAPGVQYDDELKTRVAEIAQMINLPVTKSPTNEEIFKLINEVIQAPIQEENHAPAKIKP